jgi:hypothetical protein
MKKVIAIMFAVLVTAGAYAFDPFDPMKGY